MLLGSHLSIAGGLHRALEKAHEYRFDCVGLFLRNQIQWSCRPLDADSVRTFRDTRRRLRIGPVLAHASYLINLAGQAVVRQKSIAAMREDLMRCEHLGIEFLVFHPGSSKEKDEGIRLIAEGLNEILPAAPGTGVLQDAPKILLETTAGQGKSIGDAFEDLSRIISLVNQPDRLGICLDTCHIFAAGYDIRTPSSYRKTMDAFERIIGFDKLLGIHLNDSRRNLGVRVDRHAHIGEGKIGLQGFASFVNDKRLSEVPMILETPKGTDQHGWDWDRINAQVLRSLVLEK